MPIDRRRLLAASATASLAGSSADRAFGQGLACLHVLRPKVESFLIGDLLWTKTPGMAIPRSAIDRSDPGAEPDETEFYRGRAVMLKELEAIRHPSRAQVAMMDRLRSMTFEEFSQLYFGNTDPWKPQERAGVGAQLVGHVAILEVARGRRGRVGEIHVVEAVQPHVRRIPYGKWIEENKCKHIWHGHIDGFTTKQREGFLDQARQRVGRPYGLWTAAARDLADESTFYCSKLVWRCFMLATKEAFDGNPQPTRPMPFPWISPKELLNTSRVKKLFPERDY